MQKKFMQHLVGASAVVLALMTFLPVSPAMAQAAVIQPVRPGELFPAGVYRVFNPQGEIVSEAGAGEVCLRAELDLESLRDWRAEFPALEDLEI